MKSKNFTNLVYFCENFNIFLNSIKSYHFFTDNYSAHKIFGDLYDDLSEKFDVLCEETIAVFNDDCYDFPICEMFTFTLLPENCTDCYNEFCNSKLLFINFINNPDLQNIFNLEDVKTKSGICNILDEIKTSLNKTCYLLKMCCSISNHQLEPEINVREIVIQTNKEDDYPVQTFLNPPI